jgi:outer membrane autotransporter protein
MRSFGTILKSAVAVRARQFAVGSIAFRSTMVLCLAAAMAAGFPAAAAAQKSRSVARFYVTPQAMIDSTRQIAEGVSNAVNGSLAPGPPSAPNGQILPYAGEGAADPAADAYTALGGASGVTGEFASTNQAALLWNVWSDATVAFADRNSPVAGYDGILATISLGLDRQVGDSSVLGVLLNFETSDFDTSFGPGTFDNTGYGIGVYGGTAVTDHWVADAMVVWKHFDNDLTEPGISDSFDSERWQAAANLTGYWYRDAWRYSPAVGIAWSYEDQDASAFNPAQTVTTALASAGLEIGYTTVLDDMRSLEPWASLTAEWTFHDSGATVVGPDPDLSEIDLRLAGGLNATLAENFSLSLHADIAGLVRSNFLIATIGAQAALQF